MTTAQPGQEQRMEALAQEIASGDQGRRLGPPALYGAVGLAMFKADLGGLPINRKIDAVGNAAFEALTRPTADLGEDGELVERWEAVLRDGMHHAPKVAEQIIREAADRLILYREALADPSAVHLNMLRGGIAKPSVANIWHLYGEEALLAEAPEHIRDVLSRSGR